MWWLVLVIGLVIAVLIGDRRVRRYQRDIEGGLGRDRNPPPFNPPPVHDRAGPH